MTTLSELKKEIEPYQNTLVLNYFEVVRLVDVYEDDDDFYWILDTKEGLIHSSCLIGWIPLKGKLSDEDYVELVRVWNLNNIEQAN